MNGLNRKLFTGCRFEEQEAPGSRSFFTEIIASISDIKFSKDGRHILSRDYMTLKVWTFIFQFISITFVVDHAVPYLYEHQPIMR